MKGGKRMKNELIKLEEIEELEVKLAPCSGVIWVED
jgi:hypothetical protein